jgi:23S rRNA pseudouridine1911/1915/1917 synthase
MIEAVTVEVFLDDELHLDNLRAAFRVEVDGARVREACAARGIDFQLDGRVRVDGRAVVDGNPRLRAGQVITVVADGVDPGVLPERISVRVLVETDRLLVVDKPAGLAVSPGPRHPAGTLANALRGLGVPLSLVEGPLRPGIVHRLDRGTSGAILVAKDDETHRELVRLFLARRVHRRYAAIVDGDPRWDSLLIDAPLGPRPGKKSQRVIAGGRPARTLAKVARRWGTHALVELEPETGRKHQLRAHLAHVGHPILGDTLYNQRDRRRWGALGIRRPALHATALSIDGVVTAEAPWPEDLARASGG